MFPYYEGMGRVYTDKELEELKNEGKNSIILTDEEKNTIKNYTGFDATKINKSLRLGNISNDIQKKINILDNIFKKSIPLKEDVTVYRGTIIQSISGFENSKNVTHEEIINLAESIITDKAFVSTSKIKAETQGRNIIMNIHLLKDFKGALEIENYATDKYKYQKEILIKRNTKFKVNNVVYKAGKYYFDMEVLE